MTTHFSCVDGPIEGDLLEVRPRQKIHTRLITDVLHSRPVRCQASQTLHGHFRLDSIQSHRLDCTSIVGFPRIASFFVVASLVRQIGVWLRLAENGASSYRESDDEIVLCIRDIGAVMMRLQHALSVQWRASCAEHPAEAKTGFPMVSTLCNMSKVSFTHCSRLGLVDTCYEHRFENALSS